MIRRLRFASVALWVTLLSTAVPALAERPSAPAEEAESPTEEAESWVIHVDSEAPDLEAQRIRAAVARELHRTGSWGAGELRIHIDARRGALLTCSPTSGDPRTRRVTLDPAPDAALETLVLLSTSLVRHDADALAAELGQKAPPAALSADDPKLAPAANEAPADDSPAPAPPSANEPSASRVAEPEPPPAGPAPASIAPLNLSLWHPLATHPSSDELLLHAEIGVLYGHIGALEGMGLDGLVLRIRHHLRGFAVAGIWLETNGLTEGVSISGVVQHGGGPLEGAAVAGVIDLRAADVTGLQVGGVFTSADDVEGAQIAGVLALARDVEGAQLAGALSLARDVEGAQIAGALSLAADVEGAQIAGATALAQAVEGAQISGALTHNARLRGAQVSPVNLSGEVAGAQVGLVNVGGRVRGTQVGLVNVADEVDGFPVGLVNWVGNGRNRAVAWYGGPRTPYNLGLQYHHGALYTLLAMGAKPDGDRTTWAPGFGLGGRIELFEPTFLQLDALWQQETTTTHDPVRRVEGFQVVRGRAALGVQALSWLAVFAGGGPLLEVEEDQGDANFDHHFFGGVQVF